MDSTELAQLQRRARVRYELRRLRRSLLGMMPVLPIVGLAAFITHRPGPTLWFGLASLVLGAAMLWYGRDPQRAVLPGIVAGLVPLALALCANQIHSCGMETCSSLCVPACTLGGVVAGFAVASAGNARRAGAWFWLSASSLALLTGAMGCSCVGNVGVLGLGVGYLAGMIPGILSRALGRKTS